MHVSIKVVNLSPPPGRYVCRIWRETQILLQRYTFERIFFQIKQILCSEYGNTIYIVVMRRNVGWTSSCYQTLGQDVEKVHFNGGSEDCGRSLQKPCVNSRRSLERHNPTGRIYWGRVLRYVLQHLPSVHGRNALLHEIIEIRRLSNSLSLSMCVYFLIDNTVLARKQESYLIWSLSIFFLSIFWFLLKKCFVEIA